VRIHTDGEAASLSNRLGARAFTHRNHIFFGRDEYQPGSSDGRQLLSHELTHTIQQGHSRQSVTLQRTPKVTTTASPPAVQRLGIQDALDYFADKAYYIPGFRMLTLLLGFNPINMRSADRTAANLLRALIELLPGGAVITQVLDNHGVINKAAAWVEQKIATLGDIGGQIVDGLRRFIDSLGWRDIFHLGDVWDRAKRIFTDPIGRLISFGVSVVTEILQMVKDAILRPLAALAEGTAGYDLLKAILGQDPITGEPVPRNADTLIGGFMKLIGQEEVWQNLKKGNAVARAWVWFQNALTGLMALVLAVPRKIIDTLRSLTFQDVITVVGAFRKVVGAFVTIATDFTSWGVKQVLGLLEILFSVVAPRAMPYIAKAKAAFHTIIRDPVRFVGNLVRAAKLGFQMFANNIVEHLKNALIKWITGPLGEAGVYIPKSFTLIEIVKLVLSVLGLTWQNIRAKLVKIIPEPLLTGLEKTAKILVTLVTEGPAAAWEQIKSELTELKDQLIGQVTQMISTEVVKAAVIKLVSMLNPAGAVIQAIIATYNTVTFFIEKINQIAAVVASFIDSIAAIASGQVQGAAKKVEQTMANTLTVIIAFLAKFVGLGNVPEKLVGIVKKIRQPIDKGLDRIVGWLGGLLQKLKGAGDVRTIAEKERDAQLAKNDAQVLLGKPDAKPEQISAQLPQIKTKYKLTLITLEHLSGNQFDIAIEINPKAKTPPSVLKAAVEIPKELKEGLYVKFAGAVWKVAKVGQEYVILQHTSHVGDQKQFVTSIFVEKYLAGQYPVPTSAELKALAEIDPIYLANPLAKIRGKPQTTQTEGHSQLMEQRAHHFARMITVKAVYMDRAYRLITTLLANVVGRLRRADIVVEHVSGRIDVIEIQSKSDKEEDLKARNLEVLAALPAELRGEVTVEKIPGAPYRRRR